MKTLIQYVERKPTLFVSIEKVFRRVAARLPSDKFDADFQQMPYGNDLLSVIRNLLLFRKRPADIYHVTGHVHYISLILPRGRTVLTIHDLGFLHTRHGIRRYILKKLLLDWPMRRLKFITVVSEATKNEVIKNAPAAASKIRVIENPLGDQYVAVKTKSFNTACPTVLQLGTMENKNVPNLIRALEGLSCKLKIIGPLDNAISAALVETKIDFENVEHLDDNEVLAAYRDADIVAFCSTYEGFGLPIIEGQAMRTPVVTSNISPMLEVAGYAAEFVDPFDVASIRSGIRRIMDDAIHREQLIERGVENARRFDANVIGEKYAELYEEMLKSAGY